MRKHLATVVCVTAAAIALSGCAGGESKEDKAKTLALDFANSREAHDGKYCDLLDGRSANQIAECKKDEADLKAKAAANPQPAMNPKVTQTMGRGDKFGVAVEVTQAGSQQFLAVEAVPNGDGFKIGKWNYADKADYGTDQVITKTLGW